MIATDKLSIGILFPIEAYEIVPKMENQEKLAKQAEELGFHTLWVRDVPLLDPDFKDAGQMFDPWIYLTHIAAQTKSIKLGTASAIIPLRHPIHTAKMAASIDLLYPNRLHLGLASGDRPMEYPAFNKPFQLRSADFVDGMKMVRNIWKSDKPSYNNGFGTIMTGAADILPKPNNPSIPMYVTGHAGGLNLEWIAKNSDGWIYYPREYSLTSSITEKWREELKKAEQPLKPYIQPVYIDLLENPDAEPILIDLGFRLGRNYLLDLFMTLQDLGVNHVILVTKNMTRPLDEVLDEIGKEILPNFK